jgi:hypothetical protein
MTSGIMRYGDRVRRPAGTWTPSVHEYLRHLAAAGFAGAPRVLAAGGGWEELTYLEGEVAADPDWEPGRGHRLPAWARSTDALRAAGAAGALEFLAGELRWLHAITPDLARAL